jgi:hypothetical protein
MQNHLSALMSLTSDVLLDWQVIAGAEYKIRDLRRPFGSDRDRFRVFPFVPDPDPFCWFFAALRRLTGERCKMSFSTGDQYEIDIADDIFTVD